MAETPVATPTHPFYFRHYDPFKKDRDLTYKHIGFTKRITWNYQYFLITIVALIFLLLQLNGAIKSSIFKRWSFHLSSRSWIQSLFNSNENLLIIAIFYIINAFVLFYKLPMDDSFNLALRFGLVSVSNIPLLYLIPLKNGPLLQLFNRSYESFIIYHKWIGILVISTALTHTAAFTYCLSWTYLLNNQKSITGYLCLSTFLLITITSNVFLRNRFYELFYYIHLFSFVAFLPIFYHHHYVCRPFVIIVTIALLYDRIFRLILKLWVLECKVHSNAETDSLIIEIDPYIKSMPLRKRFLSYFLFKYVRFNWRLSNHLFITIPYISAFQSHPFTIASTPDDNKLHLIVKIHSGFTKRLYNYSLKNRDQTLTCLIHGPYGLSDAHLPILSNHEITESSQLIEESIKGQNNQSFSSIETGISSFRDAPKEKIILVAGGSGVSLTLPILYHYQNDPSYDVSFIWIVRSRNNVSLIPHGFQTDSDLKIWVTSEKGRPDLKQMLYDCDGDCHKLHIIGCGPNSLMHIVKDFSREIVQRDPNIDPNLVLEEFSF